MSQFLSRIILAAAAASLLAPLPGARASGPVGGVTLIASRRLTGQEPSAINQVQLWALVGMTDLNPRTPAGGAELERRVSAASQTLCRQLQSLYPAGAPDAETCARFTAKAAAGQVKAAETGRPAGSHFSS